MNTIINAAKFTADEKLEKFMFICKKRLLKK